MNGNKFATGGILKIPVEVVKGRFLAGWAQHFICERRVLVSFGESWKAKRGHYFYLRNGLFGEGGRSFFDHKAYFKQD
jgi:hypothetical protein